MVKKLPSFKGEMCRDNSLADIEMRLKTLLFNNFSANWLIRTTQAPILSKLELRENDAGLDMI